MIIDCHTHLNQYTPDGLSKLLTAAGDDGVGVFIDESVSAENAREVVAVANEREGIYCGVATMPWFIDTWADTDLETFAELIQTNDKIVCVGECGCNILPVRMTTGLCSQPRGFLDG